MDQWITVAENQCRMLGAATLYDRMETSLHELIVKYLYTGIGVDGKVDELPRVHPGELGKFISKNKLSQKQSAPRT